MPDHETHSQIRKSRALLERIDRELTSHIRREHDRDMRNADKEGRLQGRLDRIEASLANLGTLINNIDTKLDQRTAGANS